MGEECKDSDSLQHPQGFRYFVSVRILSLWSKPPNCILNPLPHWKMLNNVNVMPCGPIPQCSISPQCTSVIACVNPTMVGQSHNVTLYTRMDSSILSYKVVLFCYSMY